MVRLGPLRRQLQAVLQEGRDEPFIPHQDGLGFLLHILDALDVDFFFRHFLKPFPSLDRTRLAGGGPLVAVHVIFGTANAFADVASVSPAISNKLALMGKANGPVQINAYCMVHWGTSSSFDDSR